MRIDTIAHEVTLNGEPITLQPLQYTLLVTLARHPGQVLSRTQLLALAWPDDRSLDIYERSVDVGICKLRRAIRDGAAIKTILRSGYKISER